MSNFNRESFVSSDEKEISLLVWDKVDAPRAILQLVHGMAEHAARYDDFATFLNKNGIIVVGDDHRAHGQTDLKSLGKAGKGDLFEDTVADEIGITKMVKQRYNLPVVLLGHSYGSFLAQRYLMQGTNEISGCILSGSALMKGMIVSLGYKVAAGKCKRGKGDDSGDFFAKQTFYKYDKHFAEGLNAWLSRDLKQVGIYNTDPLCGFTCSNAFYKYFFKGLKTISSDSNDKIDPNLKLLITSGAFDYVGGCGKLVNLLFDKYVELGLSPKLKLYSGARHEIINEINNAEVYNDLLAFINVCV